MSYYKILELSKNRNLDDELNGIIVKVTALASLSPVGGEEVRNILDEVIKKRNELARKREYFLTDLQAVIVGRDISEAKVKK